MQGYEESFFYLTLVIKRLAEGLRLGLDPQFFEERILDDADFLDSILLRLQTSLLEQTHLIQKDEYLHQLVMTRSQFCDVLSEMVRQAEKGGMFVKRLEDLRDILSRHQKENNQLLNQLETVGSDLSAEEVISKQELAFLLQDHEET